MRGFSSVSGAFRPLFRAGAECVAKIVPVLPQKRHEKSHIAKTVPVSAPKRHEKSHISKIVLCFTSGRKVGISKKCINRPPKCALFLKFSENFRFFAVLGVYLGNFSEIALSSMAGNRTR